MDQKLKLIADTFGHDRVKLNHHIKEYTALGVGGSVGLFFVAFSQHEIIRMLQFCKQLKLKHLLFGTGSKMMVSNHGFDGVVIKNRTKNIKVVSIKGKVGKGNIGVESALVEVESGVGMKSLCEFLDKQGLLIVEFIGSPGSIGGNLFANKNLQEKAESIKVLNEDLETENIAIKDLSLQKHIILSVILKIKAK